MNYQDVSTLIKTLMTGVSVNAEYPNLPFVAPENEPYVSLRIDFFNRAAYEVGGSTNVDGTVVVEVRSPENSSTETHDALCLEVQNIFSDIDSGALRFTVGRVQTLGLMNGRYRSRVVVPFFYLED